MRVSWNFGFWEAEVSAHPHGVWVSGTCGRQAAHEAYESETSRGALGASRAVSVSRVGCRRESGGSWGWLAVGAVACVRLRDPRPSKARVNVQVLLKGGTQKHGQLEQVLLSPICTSARRNPNATHVRA